MRKGEQRKRMILETAERMFYRNGYDDTSVQDIIDALSLSKGGFYHHFESKSQLLETLCEEKVDQSLENAQVALDAMDENAIDRINALFSEGGIWREENIDFIALFIRVAYRDDNLIMREKFRRLTTQGMLPLLHENILRGVSQGVFFTTFGESIGKIIMQIMNNLTDEIALSLDGEGDSEKILVEILDNLDLYRHSVERLLDAPYGSLILYEMSAMARMCQAIMDRQRSESWEDWDMHQQEWMQLTYPPETGEEQMQLDLDLGFSPKEETGEM